MTGVDSLTQVCPDCRGHMSMACPTCRGYGMVAPAPKTPHIQAVIGATVWNAHLCQACLAEAAKEDLGLEVFPSTEKRCTSCGAE